MNERNTLVAVALFGAAAVCGCRNPMLDYEANLVSGNYAAAAAIASEEVSDGGNDELQWRLMAGSASRLAGDDGMANAQFDRAEDVMIEHDRTSIFAKGATGAWAMMTNDRAFPYDGGGQDRIMTCLYKAIDFAAAGKPDAARTELNRAAQHQENWLHERRKEIADAQDRLSKDAEAYRREKQSGVSGVPQGMTVNSASVVSGAFANSGFAAQVMANSGFNLATDGNLNALQPMSWMNPYASHVTGVFRWLNGDECRNSLRDAATYSRSNPTSARDLSDVERGVKPQNQVWVWFEDGLAPKREEWRMDLPLVLIPHLNRYVLYAGMAFPKLVDRPAAGSGWSVGGAPMAELLDMDAKVKTEFKVYFRAALAREITRTAVKIGSQVALGVVAENINDNYTRYALKASQLATAAWAASTTAADTRSWTALPKRVYAARIDRPADGKVTVSGSYGPVAEVIVPPGNSMIFVSKPSAMAVAAVKVVTYP